MEAGQRKVRPVCDGGPKFLSGVVDAALLLVDDAQIVVRFGIRRDQFNSAAEGLLGFGEAALVEEQNTVVVPGIGAARISSMAASKCCFALAASPFRPYRESRLTCT